MLMKYLSIECDDCGWKKEVTPSDSDWKELVETEVCPNCVDRDIEPEVEMGEE